MSVYGAVANGVREFRIHQTQQVELALDQSNFPQFPESQEDLTKRVLRLDRAKQYMDFANGIVDEILKNITQLQP